MRRTRARHTEANGTDASLRTMSVHQRDDRKKEKDARDRYKARCLYCTRVIKDQNVVSREARTLYKYC